MRKRKEISRKEARENARILLNIKGIAFEAAIQTGIVPKVTIAKPDIYSAERIGYVTSSVEEQTNVTKGYDIAKIEKFWDEFSTELARMRKRNHENRRKYYKITPKGIAVCSAIEVGLLPEVIKDGIEGYDTTKFDKFWTRFTNELIITFGFENFDELWNTVIENSSNNEVKRSTKETE